jgi:hypothetical protein
MLVGTAARHRRKRHLFLLTYRSPPFPSLPWVSPRRFLSHSPAIPLHPEQGGSPVDTQSNTLLPGDALLTSCEWNSLGRNTTTSFGESTDDEM